MRVIGLSGLAGVVLLAATMSRASAEPPIPYGPLPSERQLKWHEVEFYCFIHFTINTFTDKEWGGGGEKPNLFSPTSFDADQIAGTAKMAGMKGLILTCKHHDGFCLWPSKYTEHSVKNSPWEDGKGDMVREFSDACRRHGLKFGVYLSPWDRNHADYARPEYITYFRNQLRELLTEYGSLFEVWFDGANGGTGYYGGANERRGIDRHAYYDWSNTWQIVRELQPDACLFSDVGPDIRWVGNEHGHAGDPCWATYTPHGRDGKPPAPGSTQYKEGENGHRDGEHWLPAEVDVSIRPGWFYHANQDDKVRTPRNLVNLYYDSVGHGASFLLNLPPDRRGMIHENDVASLRGFQAIIDATFGTDLAKGAVVTCSNVRGSGKPFAGKNVIDHNRATYWSTDDAVTSPNLELLLPGERTFNVVSLREYLPLGQRIDTWALDRREGDRWVEFAAGKGIGNRRLWRGSHVTTDRVRLRLSGPVCPALSEFALHAEPANLTRPTIARDKQDRG